MTQRLENPRKERLTKEETSEIIEIMTKILGVPKQEIMESINLFSNIDVDMKNCLDRLCQIHAEDYTSASMLLEYFLTYGKSAFEIIRN